MAVKKRKPAKGCGWCAYLGPGIRGIISQGQIYDRDAASVQAELRGGVLPALANLIVSGDALPEAMQAVKTPGTALHRDYNALLKQQQ